MISRRSSTYVFVLLAVICVACYAYYESREYIHGPQLAIASPTDGFSTSEEPLTVAGTAHNITAITLNGRGIFVDESGHFSEDVLLMPGYNVLTIAVTDRYERTNVQHLRGVYTAAFGEDTRVRTDSLQQNDRQDTQPDEEDEETGATTTSQTENTL